ncbi:MAG: MFS transporter [Planctomycetaceae bacterium]|nr:MFS transporter [Planctomycetaceae bacterium]
MSNGQPSRVRYWVVFAAMLMAVLLYLDRFCVSFAEPYIRQDLGLSSFQMGLFLSAFFLTYALAQVPSGWLSDRYGARVMLVVYILAWSLFSGLIGVAYGFAMLLAMRAACGLGQAGAYPTSASIISKWIPFSGRGAASSIVALGGRFGGAIAPALTAFLIVMLVPVSKPSKFEANELLDPAGLCSRVAPKDDGSFSSRSAEHVWERLGEDLQEQVGAVAREFRPIEQQQNEIEAEAKILQRQFRFFAAQEVFEKAAALEFETPAAVSDAVISQLNQTIDSSDFYDKDVFGRMKKLDRAAIKFMKQVNAGGSLTDDERKRFHRLLLEATFPSELGKVYVGGWRPVMIIYGFAGIIVAGMFWLIVRNRPEQHPRCNEEERAFISDGRPEGAPGPHGKPGNVPWKALLTSRSMWLSCFAQVGTNIGWVFLVTWFPRFLLEQHDVPILERGTMASVPLFIGWIGSLSGGRFTDWLVPRVGLKSGRRIPWSVSRFVAMIAFLLCPTLDTPWAVTFCLSVVAFSTDFGSPSGWAFCQDVGGRYVGSVLGWGNMWGNLGATISPILLAWVFETQGWSEMFFVCAAAFLFAGFCAAGIDATKPIDPADDSHEVGKA